MYIISNTYFIFNNKYIRKLNILFIGVYTIYYQYFILYKNIILKKVFEKNKKYLSFNNTGFYVYKKKTYFQNKILECLLFLWNFNCTDIYF